LGKVFFLFLLQTQLFPSSQTVNRLSRNVDVVEYVYVYVCVMCVWEKGKPK
jgi:hypothetical protein